MKLSELLLNQRIIIQLNWTEQTIEFYSDVLDINGDGLFVTPYLHNGSALELNITPDKGVICNVFADNPVTNQRISWKAVELTTVEWKNKTVYSLKTRGFNHMATPDDRRRYERVAVQADGMVSDKKLEEEIAITINDISSVGISFWAPEAFDPKSQQFTVTFTDEIDNKIFDVKAECSISRVTRENGRKLVGCRIVDENKNYQLYVFMKRLKAKNEG